MKKIIDYGHQGDLNFRKVNSIPQNLKKCKQDKKRGGFTLALGEHSGHAHTLVADSIDTKMELLQDESGRHYINISQGTATLLHGTFVAPAKIDEKELDKHNPIQFGVGIYEQDFEEEYDPFTKKINKVID